MRRSKRIAMKNADSQDKTMPKSTSSASSQRQIIEARATREMAELQRQEVEVKRQEIEAEKALVQARLQEELASLHSGSSAASRRRTKLWVESTYPRHDVDVHMREEKCDDKGDLDASHDVPEGTGARIGHRNVEDRRHEKDCDAVLHLTNSLPKALTLSQGNNDKLLGRLTSNNLPTFSGDALDWLRFKNAYDVTTRVGRYSEEENLARLQRCLQGEAWEAVAARLIATTSASDVMKILEMRFGRSDLVLGRLIAEMKRVLKLTGMRSEVVILATKVDNCVVAIQSAGNIGYLHSPELVSEILKKLTEPMFFRCLDFSKGIGPTQPQLTWLAKYLMSEAQEICKRGMIEPPLKGNKHISSFKPRTLLTTNEMEEYDTTDSGTMLRDTCVTITAIPSHKRDVISCVFCSEVSHTIKTCPKFKAELIDKRWEWVIKHRLCFRCLSSAHRRDRCKSKKKCSICNMSGHHALLHKDKPKTENRVPEREEGESSANVWSIQKKKVHLKALPVEIEGPAGTLSTYALLDEGSTVTLIEKKMADQIRATGAEVRLSLQGAVSGGNEMSSRVVSLMVRTSEGAHRLDRVRTVEKLTLPSCRVSRGELSCELLKDIPLAEFEGKPTLLIGQDNWHEVREGKKNEPVASRTLLGWVLHGFSSSITERKFETSCHLHDDDEMHTLIQDYFRLDSIGIKYQDVQRYSPDERRALHILDTKSKKIGDRWETGLLWKSNDVEFPNNRRNAEIRLRTIEKMMDSDASFAVDYTKQVQNMLEKNYAEEVPGVPSGRVWFLPHFGVRNPNKPGKLRLVHDAKAETKGVTLNSELLAGPDLLNSLVGVLLRFREHEVAITGDIREMFMQVKIAKEDQNAQCFLWRGMDRINPPLIFRMTSMIFGAKSSPCTATYILRRNAKDFAVTHPRAVEAVNRRHYVDDYLDSVKTEEEAVQLLKDVSMIHKAGGFEIRGWASNRLSILPQSTKNYTVSLLLHSNEVERTLGMNWKPESDTLGFDFSLKKVDKKVVDCLRNPTKREILKVVMSVFDPLGLICSFIIKAKIFLQELWRGGKNWDEQIDDMMAQRWFQWVNNLKKLEGFSIPRFYGFAEDDNIQLHVFVDASEEAYACVIYLFRNGQVSFVIGKCRVAPLKAATIPRLELQAALMGARLGNTVVKEQSLVVQKRYFWTDSKTVWFWINNNPRKNKVFISNRLSEIDELTKPHEWRWLPGKINVADEATRSKDNVSDRWLSGPDFLRLPEENWPQIMPEPEMETSEMEQEDVAQIVEDQKLISVERFSNWRRLVRSLCYVLLFIDKYCRKKSTELIVTPDLEQRAEQLVIKQAQQEMFQHEITALKRKENLKSYSKLLKLNPELNVDGLLVAKSRLDFSTDLPEEIRRPIVLDARHIVARLIIEYYHRKLGHNNVETLYNELRQRFYMFGLRTTVRAMINGCVTCKAKRCKPAQPMMAALPEFRLQQHCRPFTYCGIDLFGPMMVAIGRRREKRWGVIFTCFSTRAVHLELAASLSMDSAILAIRRMAAHRGFPRQIHSDNGTNFRSADKELRKAIRDLLSDRQMAQNVNDLGVKWTFNPPETPHMGGVWERLDRSVKTALSSTLLTQTHREEVLLTLLIEAENIVNSRPLTHVSLDINDEEGLTPNHFLIGSSNPLPCPGVFSDEDLHLRKQWRLAQRLVDRFWSRWVREYLPSLQARSRWTNDVGSPVRVGDIVLVADKGSPRNVWPRGKVVTVFPGRDGRVRSVEIATKGNVIRRPANRLVVLVSRPTEE